MLIEGLVLAHAVVVIAINTPRDGVAPAIRVELERATNANGQFFADRREQVRARPTFTSLPATDRAEIERIVFEVNHPNG